MPKPVSLCLGAEELCFTWRTQAKIKYLIPGGYRRNQGGTRGRIIHYILLNLCSPTKMMGLRPIPPFFLYHLPYHHFHTLLYLLK